MPPVKKVLPFDQLMRVRCTCGHTLSQHHHGMGKDSYACPCLMCIECEQSPTQMGCQEFHETGVFHPAPGPPVVCVCPPVVQADTETEVMRPARQQFVQHGDFQIQLSSTGMLHLEGPNGLQDRGMSHGELIQLHELTSKAIAKLVTDEDDRKNRGK